MPGAAYVEEMPPEILRPFVVCTWMRDGAVAAAGANSGSTDRILPDGCVDIIWNGEVVFVAGPDTGPVLLERDGAPTSYAGIRFRPGAAPGLLGLPASELRDQRVPLDAIWGAGESQRITESLARRASTRDASALLSRVLVARLDAPVDPLVVGAVNAIATSRVPGINGLAARLGVTDRTLHRRVQSAVGYGPKVLQRVARFRRFLASAHRHEDIGLGGLASFAGYADQAHLSRECNALAGLTPRQLALGSDVRLVQDGMTVAGACSE